MRFNQPSTIGGNLPNATVNLAGGLAFKPELKTELFLRSATSILNEKYYSTSEQEMARVKELVATITKSEPLFVLKLAGYCRNVLNLRTVPLVLLAEYANNIRDMKIVVPNSRQYVPDVVRRVDEITELLAYQLNRNIQSPRPFDPSSKSSMGEPEKKNRRRDKNTPVPMLLQYGLIKAFNNFDEYQFGKYDRETAVKLKDALFLVHPKSKDKAHKLLFDRIVNGELETPHTWEVVISTQGSSKKTWESVIPDMGYMALLRNLRNFLEKDVNIAPVLKMLTSPNAIMKSKQFPFRFYSAYRQLERLSGVNSIAQSQTMKALNQAMMMSVANVPRLNGSTAILIDLSGSMDSALNDKSTVSYKDIASVFGALSNHISDASVTIGFGDVARTIPLNTDIIASAMAIKSTNVGFSTHAGQAVRLLAASRTKVDRIVLFSDMQCYTDRYSTADFPEEFIKYARAYNPKVKLFSVDMAGYGTTVMPENYPNVSLLAGWSEQILKFIPLFETDRAEMMKAVEAYTPKS